MTTIFELAAAGDTDGVIRRLQYGASDVNAVTRDGFSALHLAVQEGHLELVDFLLTNGADVNLPSAEGVTPIFMVALAPRSTQVALVQRLLAKHASVAAKNTHGVGARDYLKTLGSQPLRDWIGEQGIRKS